MKQEKVLSIDEIMQNVGKEVAHRSAYNLDKTPTSLAPQPAPKITLEPVISFSQKSIYHRDEFMAYDDLEFVENAFLGILQRPADETGLSGYVNFMRNGGDKEFVLVDLLSSDEAKNNGVVVTGLRWHHMRNRLRKVFPNSQYIASKLQKLDRLFSPWYRSNPALRHQLSVQRAVNQHAQATSLYLEQQLKTYAEQVELQAGQIKQLGMQVQVNQSDLAICRGHTHSLLSRLEGGVANDNVGQYDSCDTRAGLSGAAAVSARQHQPSETAAAVSAGRNLDCQWVLKAAKSLAVTGTLGAGTAGRAAAGR